MVTKTSRKTLKKEMFAGISPNTTTILVDKKLRDRIKVAADELEVNMYAYIEVALELGLDAMEGLDGNLINETTKI